MRDAESRDGWRVLEKTNMFSRLCLFASRPADLLAVFAAVCCFSLVSCGSLDSFYLLAMAALTVSTVEAIAVVFTC